MAHLRAVPYRETVPPIPRCTAGAETSTSTHPTSAVADRCSRPSKLVDYRSLLFQCPDKPHTIFGNARAGLVKGNSLEIHGAEQNPPLFAFPRRASSCQSGGPPTDERKAYPASKSKPGHKP